MITPVILTHINTCYISRVTAHICIHIYTQIYTNNIASYPGTFVPHGLTRGARGTIPHHTRVVPRAPRVRYMPCILHINRKQIS